MIATHRVKNSKNQTVGFIINNTYVKYFNVLRNIEHISNLKQLKNGAIRANKKLKDISIIDINKELYNKECKRNPLVRDIQIEIETWMKKWSTYMLCLCGARQIGKTTELTKFAYKNYEQIIYVNLAEKEKIDAFVDLVIHNDHRFGLMNYCRRMGLEEFCDDASTILIIDEIQESSEVYNSIRSLQSSLNCHIVTTGSYLGKVLNTNYFKPAGNLYDVEMLPLSFKEFCKAFGKDKELLTIDLYGKDKPSRYQEITKLYLVYRQIGGYPAVVQCYMTLYSIDDCYKVIETIIFRFTEESATYFKDDKSLSIYSIMFTRLHS